MIWGREKNRASGNNCPSREIGGHLMDKQVLINAMKNYFGDDEKRIKHALHVLAYAERILKQENGNPDIVIPSAIFHDIMIHEAERKYGSNAGRYQEIE